MSNSEKPFRDILEELGRPTQLEDIDFRIQSINKGKFATILAYKDARLDMRVLDEVVGPENWQRDHKELKSVLYGGIGIFNPETKEWVWKWDAGTESMTEAQKGEASDSFKRAGFNWGIGRDLYDFPLVQFKLNDDEVTEYNGKYRAKFGLLESFKFTIERGDQGEMKYMKVVDKHGLTRFQYPTEGKAATPPPAAKAKSIEDVKALLEGSPDMDSLAINWKTICSWGFGKDATAHGIKDEMKAKLSTETQTES